MSPDAKIVAAVVAIGLLGIGGYVAANGLERSVAGAEADGAQVELVTTTVRKLVTVERGGRVVTAPTRVVAQRAGSVVTDRQTAVRVVTVTGPVETRVVTERDVVPVVRREQVAVPGAVRTIVQQAPGETVIRTVDQPVERVVERVVTEERVVTVPVTRTVTETVVHTIATPPVTVTAEPIVVTVTIPKPGPPRKDP